MRYAVCRTAVHRQYHVAASAHGSTRHGVNSSYHLTNDLAATHAFRDLAFFVAFLSPQLSVTRRGDKFSVVHSHYSLAEEIKPIKLEGAPRKKSRNYHIVIKTVNKATFSGFRQI